MAVRVLSGDGGPSTRYGSPRFPKKDGRVDPGQGPWSIMRAREGEPLFQTVSEARNDSRMNRRVGHSCHRELWRTDVSAGACLSTSWLGLCSGPMVSAQGLIVGGRRTMHIRFLIPWLALGLLAAGGVCSKAYEIKVLTDFNSPSIAEFSAFFTRRCSFGDDGQRARNRGV